MERILAVMTKETAYARRLCEYINTAGRLSVVAVPFGSSEELKGFRHKTNIRMVLADRGSMDPSFDSDLSGAETILLSENRLKDDVGIDFQSSIYKYQSADAIQREIINISRDSINPASPEKGGKERRIIGVYSPDEKNTAELFSLVLCKTLERHKKILLLNFEEFPQPRLCSHANGDSITDAFYYLKRGELNDQKLMGMVHSTCGIDFLPAAPYANDLHTTHSEDYSSLVGLIFRESLYDTIVICMSDYVCCSTDIPEMCSPLYIPVSGEKGTSGRMSSFENYLDLSGRSKLKSKLIKPVLPKTGGYRGENMDALVYGPWGDLIRQYELL